MRELEAVGVSVVMPAFNAEKTISQAISSVLEQSHRKLELIVVDDGSCDTTAAIVRAWGNQDDRVTYLQNQQNTGVAASRNRGIAAARYPWVAFLDSDDTWAKDKLERQLRAIHAHPDAAICFTGSAFVDEGGKRAGYVLHVPEKITFRELLKQNLISCSSALVRAEMLRRHPMCRERNLHEDYATWLSILRRTPYAVGIDMPLLVYRISSASRSGDKRRSCRMQWRTYRYMGLPVWKAAFYFAHYAHRNLKKYRSIFKTTG